MSEAPGIRAGTPAARWVLATTVLGSGIAFLDGTVVNVALPAIASDLDADLAGLQWVLDGYLVTLTAFLLLGGSLGDLFGRRRVYQVGLVAFTVASVACAAAPTVGVLVVARAVQGIGGALLVPGSLAIISATFHPDDRGRAVGTWSGLAGVTSAIGPFVGGWLIDAASWRFVFLINVPIAAVALVFSARVPETRDPGASHRPDLFGAALGAVGLAAVAFALIETDRGAMTPAAAAVGLAALAGFVLVEAREQHPMLPLGVFRNRQFAGANLTTFAVYGGLGGAIFLLVIELQLALDYSALEAGAALLPVTVLMLALSSRSGALAQKIGPRLPMTIGPLGVATGLLVFTRVGPGASYLTTVLPGALVFGAGLVLTVAPLTATVMASVENAHVGVASGVNNAVSRLAGLLAVAVLPRLAGLDTGDAASLTPGFRTAMRIAAGLCVVGAAAAFATVRRISPLAPVSQGGLVQPCHDQRTATAAA